MKNAFTVRRLAPGHYLVNDRFEVIRTREGALYAHDIVWYWREVGVSRNHQLFGTKAEALADLQAYLATTAARSAAAAAIGRLGGQASTTAKAAAARANGAKGGRPRKSAPAPAPAVTRQEALATLRHAELAVRDNPTDTTRATYETAFQAAKALQPLPKRARFASRAGQRQANERRSLTKHAAGHYEVGGINIEKQWDGNECVSEYGNREYASRGRWQWVVSGDGIETAAFDRLSEAKFYIGQQRVTR